MQRAHVGEIGVGTRVRRLQPLQPGFHVGDVGVVVLEEFLIAGQQEAALRGHRSGDPDLQLIDEVFALRGLLQALARFLQAFLTRAGQEE